MTGPDGGGGDASSSAQRRRRRPEPSPTQRAIGLLSRREHSRQELGRKLAARGVEPGDALAVVDKLAAAGWQDDKRFADSLVRARAAAGYGPLYVRAELGTHGIPAEAAASALGRYDGDWVENAATLLRRRHPKALAGDRDARNKALDTLMRRGFPMEEAKAALRHAAEVCNADDAL